MKPLVSLLAIFLSVAFAAPAGAAWPLNHATAANNAATGIATQVTDLAQGIHWATAGNQNLNASCGMTMLDHLIFTSCQTGSDTWGDTSDDVMTVKAFHALDGRLVWESPALDPGFSVDYWSISAPAVDVQARAVFFMSGPTMYKLDADTGAILASTTIDAANSTPGLSSYDNINGSPMLGAGMVFIETYGGYVPSNRQLIAFHASDLSIAWVTNEAGFGSGTPCFVAEGAGGRIYSAPTHAVSCRDALTGDLLWKSDELADAPWSTGYDILASLVYDGGKIYGVTYDFSEPECEFFCADAATGALDWNITGLSSDVPPLLLGGKAYLQGGAYGDAHVKVVDLANHTVTQDVATGGNSYKTNMAATEDRIYMTNGSSLMVIDPADGSVLSQLAGSYDGPVTIDPLGGLIVHWNEYGNTGLRAIGQTVPVTLSSFEID